MLTHLDNYLWIVFLLYAFWSTKSVRTQLEELHGKPLGWQHRLFLCGYFVFFAAPFLVVGAGRMSGATQGLSTYLSCERGAFVWTFLVVVLLLYVGLGIWIWFFNGAKFLIENEIVKARSAGVLKFEYGIGLFAVGVVLVRCSFHPPAG